MPPPTRRYAIDLVVNTQQTAGPQAGAGGGAGGAGGTAGLDISNGMIDRIGRYILGMQGIRMAWNEAKAAMDVYVAAHDKMEQKAKTQEQKALDFQKSMRTLVRNEGGFTDPSVRARVEADVTKFARSTGFSMQDSVNFMTKVSSDVKQFAGDPKDPRAMHLMHPEELKKLTTMVGQSANASNMPTDSAVQMMGSLVGSTDWTKFGGNAANEAYTKYERASQIMQQGRGDPGVNASAFSKLMNQMVQVNREQGRITGDDAAEKVALIVRSMSQYNPQQAETYGRNYIEGIRNLGSPAMKKMAKQAGVDYGDEAEQSMKLLAYYTQLQKDGKIPEGKTFADWIKQDLKMNIRAASGLNARTTSLTTGQDQAALASVEKMTTATTPGMLKTFMEGDKSLQTELAKAGSEVEETRRGSGYAETSDIKELISQLATRRGWGDAKSETRSWTETTGTTLRRWLPDMYMSGAWDTTQDSAQLEVYKRMAGANHAGQKVMSRGLNGTPSELTLTNAEDAANYYGDKFYRATPDQRRVMLDEEAQKYGMDKIVDELKRANALQEEANRKADGGLGGNPVGVPGMIH